MNVKIVHTAPRAVVLAGNRFQEEPQTFWRCKNLPNETCGATFCGDALWILFIYIYSMGKCFYHLLYTNGNSQKHRNFIHTKPKYLLLLTCEVEVALQNWQSCVRFI